MSDLVAWIKEHVRKNHLKEFIRTHTGLTPPAFIAVAALATACTCLTVSAVSSLLAPPKINKKELDSIPEEESMTYSNKQREVGDPLEKSTVEEPEEEDEAPAEEAKVEAPSKEIKDLAEEAEVPEKEDETEKTASTVGEDNNISDYVDVNETATDD